jgi:dTDP-4-amino-4,6-dideoxygalactose transaminase
MSLEHIWLSKPEMSDKEKLSVARAIETDQISMGSELEVFRSSLETVLGQDSQVALVQSGTAALHLALLSLGIGHGDEVFCPTLTFAASANPILYCGATPVFVDSEKTSWNISPDLLEEAVLDRIRHGKRPRAVIAVDLYGMPCDYHSLRRICEKFEIFLIEDAAEGLGGTFCKSPLGTFGDVSILSFNANKIITTGGGGAFVSKNVNRIEYVSLLASQAREQADYYLHHHVGYNYRMNNLAAAIGAVQLETLEQRVLGRRRVFKRYCDALHSAAPRVQCETVESYSNRWLSVFCFPVHTYSWVDIQAHLKTRGIESRPIWKPLHTQPVFRGYPAYLNGVAEEVFEKGICLPSNSFLEDTQIDFISKEVISVLNRPS